MHDRISHLIAALVELLAEEADTDIENAGSTTFKREDLSRGFEPDECFHFGSNAGRVRELVADEGNIELHAGDPAPRWTSCRSTRVWISPKSGVTAADG